MTLYDILEKAKFKGNKLGQWLGVGVWYQLQRSTEAILE